MSCFIWCYSNMSTSYCEHRQYRVSKQSARRTYSCLTVIARKTLVSYLHRQAFYTTNHLWTVLAQSWLSHKHIGRTVVHVEVWLGSHGVWLLLIDSRSHNMMLLTNILHKVRVAWPYLTRHICYSNVAVCKCIHSAYAIIATVCTLCTVVPTASMSCFTWCYSDMSSSTREH
jgi:hypothetical protein